MGLCQVLRAVGFRQIGNLVYLAHDEVGSEDFLIFSFPYNIAILVGWHVLYVPTHAVDEALV